MERNQQTMRWLALAALMIATRPYHFGDALHLPDASLSVFFVAGLWFKARWPFLAMVAMATGIDLVALAECNSVHPCMTPAYAVLPLAYACPWLAGRWLQGPWHTLRGLPAYAPAVVISMLCAFLISNGGYYALSGHFGELSLAEYSARVAKYVWPYTRSGLL